jgi:DNA-binding CsgD family transcriptional regulator
MAQDQARGRHCRCRSGADHLTDREVEVLLLVAAGKHNKEIAEALGISTRTVDHHLRTMLRRAGVQGRAELVARCYAAEIMVGGTWPPACSGSRCLGPPGVPEPGRRRETSVNRQARADSRSVGVPVPRAGR